MYEQQDAALHAQALERMKQRDWSGAAELLGRMSRREPATEMHRRVTANFAALQKHHPAAFTAVLAGRGEDLYSVVSSASGLPTLTYRRADNVDVCLSPAADPAAAALSIVQQLAANDHDQQGIAVCGMGDGYLAGAMAQHPPKLMFGRTPPIYIIEPDAKAMLACLMIHDYSGANGPIEQERFRWFVGHGWEAQLRQTLQDDPFLICPLVHLYQGVNRSGTEAGLTRIIQQYIAAQTPRQHEIEAYYARVTREQLVELFGPNPPRRPRVLLLTTRFSGVIQHSTRDAADAFAQLGWETHLIIEPSACGSVTPVAIRSAIASFKPDLFFQIDHLRYEHPNLIPPQLPFACWIQDTMPNLACAQAGRSIGPRDFVLAAQVIYAERYGYPQRQVIPIHRLTRLPELPAKWSNDGDDLVYVSNASQVPEDAATQIVRNTPDLPQLRDLARLACGRIIDTYRSGASLPTHVDVARLMAGIEQELGLPSADSEVRRQMLDMLFYRLANVMHRQQGLAWAASIAQRMGLSLSVYGRDWDKHPQFASHARGPVAYGADLESLTRRAKINLQLEPYFGISHQRLLDGLAAGGFFLIRHHPAMTLIPRLSAFLRAHLPEQARDSQGAMSRIGQAHRAELEALLNECACLNEMGDPVAQTRGCQGAELVAADDSILPRFDDILFDTEASLAGRIERFIADESLRRQIADVQRQSMAERLSYRAGMKRLIGQMGQLILEEPVPAGKAVA